MLAFWSSHITQSFWSSNIAQEITNFLGGPIQTFEGLSGLGVVIVGYRMVNCHRTGCMRLGRFGHGHLRLCHKHHPLVSDDGTVTAADVARVSASG